MNEYIAKNNIFSRVLNRLKTDWSAVQQAKAIYASQGKEYPQYRLPDNERPVVSIPRPVQPEVSGSVDTPSRYELAIAENERVRNLYPNSQQLADYEPVDQPLVPRADYSLSSNGMLRRVDSVTGSDIVESLGGRPQTRPNNWIVDSSRSPQSRTIQITGRDAIKGFYNQAIDVLKAQAISDGNVSPEVLGSYNYNNPAVADLAWKMAKQKGLPMEELIKNRDASFNFGA